jgi:predicted negative regulator of RcsB-dependent stress response
MSKNKKIILIVGGVILIGVGGYFGYKAYQKSKGTTKQPPEVQAIINKIKADATWYASIKQKAKDNKISVEKQLIADAKFVLANP